MTKEQLKRLNGALWLALTDISNARDLVHGNLIHEIREETALLDSAKRRLLEQTALLSTAILEMEDGNGKSKYATYAKT